MQPPRPGASASSATAPAALVDAERLIVQDPFPNPRSIARTARGATTRALATPSARVSRFRGDFAALGRPGEHQPDHAGDDPHIGEVEDVPFEAADVEEEEVGHRAIARGDR